MKKILGEVLILLLVYLLGLGLGLITPIPSSLASMGFLFLGLQLKLIKEEHLSVLTPLLLAHIALFFIAPAIRIVNSMELLSGSAIQVVVVLIVSNMLVMGVTGRLVQLFLKGRNNALNG